MKKVLSILLTAFLAMSLLAACDRPVNTEVNDGREQLTSAVAEAKTAKAGKTTAKATATETAAIALPTPKEFQNAYFDVIGGIEKGTSGSSLKLAKAATEVFRFAQTFEFANCDIDALRDVMLETWEGVLTEDERANFDENFMDVVTFLDGVEEDYDANAGIFEDAGVKADFDQLLKHKNAWENWNTLKAHTLTMGNSDS